MSPFCEWGYGDWVVGIYPPIILWMSNTTVSSDCKSKWPHGVNAFNGITNISVITCPPYSINYASGIILTLI